MISQGVTTYKAAWVLAGSPLWNDDQTRYNQYPKPATFSLYGMDSGVESTIRTPKKSSTNAYRRNLTMKVTSNTRTVIYFHRRFWLLGISCKKSIGTANGFRAENRIGKKRITSPARVRHLHNRITTSPIYVIGSKRLHGFTKNLCLILLQPWLVLQTWSLDSDC